MSSYNGWVLNRQQAIISTNHGIIFWRINASLSHSLKRHDLTGIRILIINLRRSDDRLRFMIRTFCFKHIARGIHNVLPKNSLNDVTHDPEVMNDTIVYNELVWHGSNLDEPSGIYSKKIATVESMQYILLGFHSMLQIIIIKLNLTHYDANSIHTNAL